MQGCCRLIALALVAAAAAAEAQAPEEEDAAARSTGFEAADRIETYLRTRMADHHDTRAARVPLDAEGR